MAPHSSLFVFDIETIPDTEAACNLLDIGKEKSIQEIRNGIRDYHLKITDGKNDFLRQPFHKIIAISFAEAEIMRNDDGTESYRLTSIRSGGNEESSEEELLRGFFGYLGKNPPRLVSFNGKNFDLPVIKYRAMKYGIQAPWFYNMGDKWNNYSQKYSLDWHCDLLDAFSDFGSSARIKIKEVCSIFNIPCKYDIDGSQVAEVYDNGGLGRIRDYCEIDVVITYLLYLRFNLHRGVISHNSYNAAEEDMALYLSAESKTHFNEFLEKWEKINQK